MLLGGEAGWAQPQAGIRLLSWEHQVTASTGKGGLQAGAGHGSFQRPWTEGPGLEEGKRGREAAKDALGRALPLRLGRGSQTKEPGLGDLVASFGFSELSSCPRCPCSAPPWRGPE